MKLIVGSDHGGLDLKNEMISRLKQEGYEVEDLGFYTHDSVDYPEIAEKVAHAVLAENGNARGILFCGTGIGVSIAANKVPGIRAALVADCYSARMARSHNDAHIICLGGRTTGDELAFMMIQEFLSSEFLGGKHERRIGKIHQIEER